MGQERNTQLQTIRDMLISTGSVSRNWCLRNYILRLGARINDLKKEGLDIDGRFVETEHGRDYVYYLRKREQTSMF